MTLTLTLQTFIWLVHLVFVVVFVSKVKPKMRQTPPPGLSRVINRRMPTMLYNIMIMTTAENETKDLSGL